MFVSASLDLKVHSSTEEGFDSHPVQHPPSQSRIVNVSICNDNSYIALLRENEKPQILSAKDRLNVRVIHTINVSNVTAIAFKHNTKRNIALGTKTGDVIMYDTKNRTVSNVFSKLLDSIKALAFTCDDRQLCGVDGDVFFVFPDVNSSSSLQKYRQAAECTFLRCHPFIANRVAIGCKNGHVSLWDVQSGNEVFCLDLLESPVSGVAMSSCGNYLVASGKDVKICGIDFNRIACNSLCRIEQEKPVTSIDLSSDDRFLAVGLSDGTVKLYDIRKNVKELYSAQLHQSSVNIIAFENKARELNSNFSSMVRISETEIKEKNEIEEQSCAMKKRSVYSGKSLEEIREESLEKMKRSLMKVIKSEIDCLESQLHEHCVKFQKFLDNEFETIDNIIQQKWYVFTAGDINQILKAICPDDSKSSCA